MSDIQMDLTWDIETNGFTFSVYANEVELSSVPVSMDDILTEFKEEAEVFDPDDDEMYEWEEWAGSMLELANTILDSIENKREANLARIQRLLREGVDWDA